MKSMETQVCPSSCSNQTKEIQTQNENKSVRTKIAMNINNIQQQSCEDNEKEISDVFEDCDSSVCPNDDGTNNNNMNKEIKDFKKPLCKVTRRDKFVFITVTPVQTDNYEPNYCIILTKDDDNIDENEINELKKEKKIKCVPKAKNKKKDRITNILPSVETMKSHDFFEMLSKKVVLGDKPIDPMKLMEQSQVKVMKESDFKSLTNKPETEERGCDPVTCKTNAEAATLTVTETATDMSFHKYKKYVCKSTEAMAESKKTTKCGPDSPTDEEDKKTIKCGPDCTDNPDVNKTSVKKESCSEECTDDTEGNKAPRNSKDSGTKGCDAECADDTGGNKSPSTGVKKESCSEECTDDTGGNKTPRNSKDSGTKGCDAECADDTEGNKSPSTGVKKESCSEECTDDTEGTRTPRNSKDSGAKRSSCDAACADDTGGNKSPRTSKDSGAKRSSCDAACADDTGGSKSPRTSKDNTGAKKESCSEECTDETEVDKPKRRSTVSIEDPGKKTTKCGPDTTAHTLTCTRAANSDEDVKVKKNAHCGPDTCFFRKEEEQFYTPEGSQTGETQTEDIEEEEEEVDKVYQCAGCQVNGKDFNEICCRDKRISADTQTSTVMKQEKVPSKEFTSAAVQVKLEEGAPCVPCTTKRTSSDKPPSIKQEDESCDIDFCKDEKTCMKEEQEEVESTKEECGVCKEEDEEEEELVEMECTNEECPEKFKDAEDVEYIEVECTNDECEGRFQDAEDNQRRNSMLDKAKLNNDDMYALETAMNRFIRNKPKDVQNDD